MGVNGKARETACFPGIGAHAKSGREATTDLELVSWLRSEGVPHLVVYTKIDKLKRNQQQRQAALLDSGLGIRPVERVLFSAKSGEGKENLISMLDQFLA